MHDLTRRLLCSECPASKFLPDLSRSAPAMAISTPALRLAGGEAARPPKRSFAVNVEFLAV